MKLSEAIAIYEDCQGEDPCEHCVLSRRIGNPGEEDDLGVAYSIDPCAFLQKLEQVLKDSSAPEVSQGGG